MVLASVTQVSPTLKHNVIVTVIVIIAYIAANQDVIFIDLLNLLQEHRVELNGYETLTE